MDGWMDECVSSLLRSVACYKSSAHVRVNFFSRSTREIWSSMSFNKEMNLGVKVGWTNKSGLGFVFRLGSDFHTKLMERSFLIRWV